MHVHAYETPHHTHTHTHTHSHIDILIELSTALTSLGRISLFTHISVPLLLCLSYPVSGSTTLLPDELLSIWPNHFIRRGVTHFLDQPLYL